MTVGELINQLNQYDKGKKVVLSEYVYKTIDGFHGYFPEPRDVAMIDNKLHDGCITLILECEKEVV